MENVVTVEAVHTQYNLIKEKINKIVASLIMYIVGIKRAGTRPAPTMHICITSVMFAHTDKYKVDEFLI